MKKSILALAAGLGLQVGNISNSHAKDLIFNKVVDSLRECAYASYKRQDSPTSENQSKENYACSKFNTLKEEKGISSLEDYFSENGWYYFYGKEFSRGKHLDSYFAAKITNKFEREGTTVYFTRLGKNGVDSSSGFLFNNKYLKTVNLSEGKHIVIELDKIEKDAIKVADQWKGYKKNHDYLVNGSLNKWKPEFESDYLCLENSNDIRKQYFNEKVEGTIIHELEHVKGYHDYDNVSEEIIAVSKEVSVNPARLYFVHDLASKGNEAEKDVLKCLIETNDIFNKQKQARFYLKGKQYIQQRAEVCYKQFLREKQ